MAEQAQLLLERGMGIDDSEACIDFLRSHNYYRFSGYARYFQRAPHLGDNQFVHGATFADIRRIYEADEVVRSTLMRQLARCEQIIRTHVARVIADSSGPYVDYLEQDYYSDTPNSEPTVESCLRDLERSKERHILRYKGDDGSADQFKDLPIWSAVEAWSFGTLSKCVERGEHGRLASAVASSIGVASSGFEYRVRALAYLRNRCAHHSRLWNHSVLDSGPTPNNVRKKAKRLAGQFEARSVLDVVASLDDIIVRSNTNEAILPRLVTDYKDNTLFWRGFTHPQSPQDRQI